jgi:hypothetical protein
MKRSADASILAFVCLVLISSIGCGSSNPNPSTPALTPKPETFAITAASGSGQSTASGKPFSAPLVASVTAGGIRTSGIKVTFIAPTTGPSGTFANGSTTDVEISNAAGTATSSVFTANSAVGNFSITATVSGAPKPVPFALTILAPAATPSFVFYVSGQEIGSPLVGGTGAYYALAGAFTTDANGNVIGGEQDYNDAPGGNSSTSAEPTPDTINSKGGSLTVDPATGLGTLTLSTNNLLLGLNQDGTETFAVQFVNPKHALITQFDGFATSSGGLDLQTFPSTLSGGYAFAVSGVDFGTSALDIGGVFTVSGTSITNGLYDLNDPTSNGAAIIGTPLKGTISSPDGFGRGTFTGITNPAFGPMTFAYYVLTPEALRLIDIDTAGCTSFAPPCDSGIGSAFGQGTGTFSNASLGASVFAVAANDIAPFGALGQFTTTSATSPPAFTGVGDDNELVNFLQVAGAAISGNYSIQSNGYGNLNLNASFALGNVNLLGIYMTDPTLNLNDPNNPAGGGGALVADLDDATITSALSGGTGVIVPQTTYASSAAASAAFAGQYAMGWQNFNELYNTGTAGCPATNCEFDMLAQGTLAAGGVFNPVTGDVSDPYLTVTPASATSGETTGNTFTGTPQPDPSNVGRYTMFSTNAPPNQLATVIGGAVGPPFDIVIYQASGGQLFWLGNDVTDPLTFGLPLTVSLGPIEQATLTGLPAARKPAANAKANKKR